MKKVALFLFLSVLLFCCKKEEQKLDGIGYDEDEIIGDETDQFYSYCNPESTFFFKEVDTNIQIKERYNDDGELLLDFLLTEESTNEYIERKIGELKTEYWSIAASPAIGDSDLKIDNIPVLEEQISDVAWDNDKSSKYVKLVFEDIEVGLIISVIIREDYKYWFVTNFTLIYG